MKSLLADNELENLSAYIADQMGLFFPPSKWRNLEQSFCTAARELGFRDIHECVARFTSPPPSKDLIEAMAGYLTIGETYFLREVRCFEILEREIIPEIIRKHHGGERHLRIWSAGCATGEEAYSIAILLHRMRDSLRGWEISILATDINPHSLSKARAGIYTEWSFRTSPPWFKQNYFRQTGNKQYELLPHIKEMVKFSSINLVDDSYPSLITDTNAINVIFCRNVLMYFTPHLAAKVVERFKRCLLDDGWLFVSPCETSNLFLSVFNPVSFPDAVLYQKSGGGKAAERENIYKDIFTTPDFPVPVSLPYPKYDIDIMPPPPAPPTRTSLLPPPRLSPLPERADRRPAYEEALTLYESGAYREAAKMVTMHLVRNKNDTHALALLSRIYANEGRLSEALNASDQALAADKLSAGLHYLRAVILQEQGMDDEAATSLKKALYLDQDLVLAHYTLANLEQRKGKVRESQRHFNNALSLLDKYRPDDVIPESDGMIAERLKEIIRATNAGM
ncbi:MAG: CheR family methyltransferase [Pelobacteraceae bacterium]